MATQIDAGAPTIIPAQFCLESTFFTAGVEAAAQAIAVWAVRAVVPSTYEEEWCCLLR